MMLDPFPDYPSTRLTDRAGPRAGQGANVEELEARLDRQHLVIQTLLHLLIQKGIIQEQEFKNWMDYVDGFDGQRDGRLRRDQAPTACPRCGRKSPRTAPRCIFCGTEFPAEFLARDRSKE